MLVGAGKGEKWGGYSRDASVICEHEPGYTVGLRHMRGFFAEGDLDGCRAPGDESRESAFADSEEGFVHIGGIGFALNDVEDGDIAAAFSGVCEDHAVFGL